MGSWKTQAGDGESWVGGVRLRGIKAVKAIGTKKVKVLGSQLCSTLRSHGLEAPQAPLSMVFSRQEYWSGLPFPSPGDLPNPGSEPRSAFQANSLPTEPLWRPGTKKLYPNLKRCCSIELKKRSCRDRWLTERGKGRSRSVCNQ